MEDAVFFGGSGMEANPGAVSYLAFFNTDTFFS